MIDTSKDSLYDTVMELTNGLGANAAIDSVGGSSGTDLAFCLHSNGNFLTIGLLSGVQVYWTKFINKAKVNANIFHLRNWNKAVLVDKWQATFNYLINLINNKKLSLMSAGSKYDLLNAKRAIEEVDLQKGEVFLTSY